MLSSKYERPAETFQIMGFSDDDDSAEESDGDNAPGTARVPFQNGYKAPARKTNAGRRPDGERGGSGVYSDKHPASHHTVRVETPSFEPSATARDGDEPDEKTRPIDEDGVQEAPNVPEDRSFVSAAFERNITDILNLILDNGPAQSLELALQPVRLPYLTVELFINALPNTTPEDAQQQLEQAKKDFEACAASSKSNLEIFKTRAQGGSVEGLLQAEETYRTNANILVNSALKSAQAAVAAFRKKRAEHEAACKSLAEATAAALGVKAHATAELRKKLETEAGSALKSLANDWKAVSSRLGTVLADAQKILKTADKDSGVVSLLQQIRSIEGVVAEAVPFADSVEKLAPEAVLAAVYRLRRSLVHVAAAAAVLLQSPSLSVKPADVSTKRQKLQAVAASLSKLVETTTGLLKTNQAQQQDLKDQEAKLPLEDREAVIAQRHALLSDAAMQQTNLLEYGVSLQTCRADLRKLDVLEALASMSDLLKPLAQAAADAGKLLERSKVLEKEVLNKMLDVQVLDNVIKEMLAHVNAAQHPQRQQETADLMASIQKHFGAFMTTLHGYYQKILNHIVRERELRLAGNTQEIKKAFEAVATSDDACVQSTMGLVQREIMAGLLGRVA